MTLSDLRRIAELLPPGGSITLPRDEVLAALDTTSAAVRPVAVAGEPETWLTAEECAKRLNVTKRWCYDHADKLGGRRLSRRCVRFSTRAVDRYMARRS